MGFFGSINKGDFQRGGDLFNGVIQFDLYLYLYRDLIMPVTDKTSTEDPWSR